MADDAPSFPDVRAAITHLLDQVAWTPVPRQGAPVPGERYATHEGLLTLPGMGSLLCYQLNTGERVFDAETVVRLFGLAEE